MISDSEPIKQCCKCERELPLSHFSKSTKRKDGLQTACKACFAEYAKQRPKRSWTNEARAVRKAETEARRNAPRPDLAARQREWKAKNPEKLAALRKKHYAKKYGMTANELEALYAEQDGKCGVCLTPIELYAKNNLHIDHCHGTGLARGLLCHKCNLGVGFFRDSAPIMRRAADYIDFWSVIHASGQQP